MEYKIRLLVRIILLPAVFAFSFFWFILDWVILGVDARDAYNEYKDEVKSWLLIGEL